MKLIGLLCGYVVLAGWLLVDFFKPEPAAHSSAVVRSEQPLAAGQGLDLSPLQSGASGERVVAPAPTVRSKAQAAPPQRAAAPDQPEQPVEDIAVVLEEKFRSDPPATRDSHERQRVIEGLFEAAELGNTGQLTKLACKGTICRGEISIASASEDNNVFNRTFLSREFALGINAAFSVSERRTLEDGRVVATFFIHPDDAVVGVPEADDGE